MENRINLIGISGKKQHGKNTVADIIQNLTVLDRVPDYNGLISRGILVSKWKQKAFAGKLKQITSILLGRPVEDFENEEKKKELLPNEWDITQHTILTRRSIHTLALQEQISDDEYVKKHNCIYIPETDTFKKPLTTEVLSVRGFLQKLGTEVGRQLHPELWVNALFSDYKTQHNKVSDEDTEEYVDELPNWIITDVRFPNEVNSIKQRGGIIIRVFRPGKLRVWYNDSYNSDEEDHSGYYYVREMEFTRNGIRWNLSEYADGKGSRVSGYLNEKDVVFEPSDNHLSETALDYYPHFDEVIINDGDIDSLNGKVKEILKKYNII